ncbi:hypothetical protein Tco_1049210, partial [Tanacetum coccineum]
MNAISINVQGFGEVEKRRWLNRLCNLHNINFLAVQETKLVHLDLWLIRQVWGNTLFDFASSSARGRLRDAELIDILLGGYSFTWTDKVASKMIKLDKFLVFESFRDVFHGVAALFNSWLDMEGFHQLVVETWKNNGISEFN